MFIDKSKGEWDYEDATELDDLAYHFYVKEFENCVNQEFFCNIVKKLNNIPKWYLHADRILKLSKLKK